MYAAAYKFNFFLSICKTLINLKNCRKRYIVIFITCIKQFIHYKS